MMLQDVMLMSSETSVRCLTCLKNRSGLLVWYTSYIPMYVEFGLLIISFFFLFPFLIGHIPYNTVALLISEPIFLAGHFYGGPT